PPADPAVPPTLDAGRPGRLPRRALDPLVAPAARLCPLCADGVGLPFELVGERLQVRRLAAEAVRERLGEQPVRQARVAGEERAVEVGPDHATDPAALVAALAVVPEAGDDASERFCAVLEHGPPGMVLETGERPLDPGLQLAREQDVADHPPLAGDGVERQQADARQLVAALVAVEPPEQLVAAADGEGGRARGDRGLQRRAKGGERRGDQLLLAILAAADVEEVVLAGLNDAARAERPHLELVAAPGGTTSEDGDVRAVGVDVQVVREQVADDDLHAACSQYGRTKPRRETSSRSASIAV